MIAGVYRLWKCTGDELDDLGIASVHVDYNGGRDFWFERVQLSERTCIFPDNGNEGLRMNLTSGAVPFDKQVSGSRKLCRP